MAESFEDRMKASLWDFVNKINRDDARVLKIKDVYLTGSIDPEEVKKLLKSVKEHGHSMLNPRYIEQQLFIPGQHVVVYDRNPDLLPDREDELPSAFLIFSPLFVEKGKKLVAPVDIHHSLDSKKRLREILRTQNLDEEEIDVQGAGTTALLDLEKFMIEFAEQLKLEICEIRYVLSELKI